MARALVLGNGQMLVCLDQFGFVRDLTFPYVGYENHVVGKSHKIGVMIDGQFSWLDDGSWEISLGYKPETMVGYLVCKSIKLGLSLVMEDIVYNEQTIFLREVSIYNHTETPRDLKLFFHQVFVISENPKRTTAFFDPTHTTLVHYRGRRVFVVNARTGEGVPMDDFSVGAYGFEDKEGTYKDAEDGVLSKNGVEHGSVDSVLRLSFKLEPKGKVMAYYWICAAKTLDDAYALNAMTLEKTPAGMLHSTEEFWNAWLNRREYHLDFLPPEYHRLFDTSLFVLRAHTDNNGGIIASADSAMIEYGKDDYAYVWPRDAAYIASVLDKAGYTEVTKPFYEFCRQVVHPDGYLHHRFNADKSLGSTWHASIAQERWLKDKLLQLPIQEDETASVLVALWKHYEKSKDVEFIENRYKPLIEKAAEFLVSFRDQETGLPLPSYDLWEEKMGISTYTCAAVYGGLQAAAHISELLGKRDHMRRYREAAQSIKEAMMKYLFSPERDSFIRTARIQDGQVIREDIVDASSLFGLWYFGVLEPDHPMMTATIAKVRQVLTNPGATGGIIRYENDAYFRDGAKSNPWFITTMWEAQRRLQLPNVGQADIDFAREVLDWVVAHRYSSGVLAEQLNPETGESLSATPLAWSHAVFVETILLFVMAYHRLGLCDDCNDATLKPIEL